LDNDESNVFMIQRATHLQPLISVTLGTAMILFGLCTPNVQVPSKSTQIWRTLLSYSEFNKFKCSIAWHFQIMGYMIIKMPTSKMQNFSSTKLNEHFYRHSWAYSIQLRYFIHTCKLTHSYISHWKREFFVPPSVLNYTLIIHGSHPLRVVINWSDTEPGSHGKQFVFGDYLGWKLQGWGMMQDGKLNSVHHTTYTNLQRRSPHSVYSRGPSS
jgi:hypothetical protein